MGSEWSGYIFPPKKIIEYLESTGYMEKRKRLLELTGYGFDPYCLGDESPD